jgi:hypothetical protein
MDTPVPEGPSPIIGPSPVIGPSLRTGSIYKRKNLMNNKRHITVFHLVNTAVYNNLLF